MLFTSRKVARYGWKPDLPDHRDLLAPPHHQFTAAKLPDYVDMRAQVPYIYDQKQLGSCTANSINAAINFEMVKQGKPALMGSRLFVYYNERAMEGDIDQDNGAQIRDGLTSVANQGVCLETEWPYDDGPDLFKTKPTDQCYKDALDHKVLQYLRLSNDPTAQQSSLAAGYPFVFGFTVFESFESDAVAKTGIVPMPHWREKAVGGHAVFSVGYNRTDKFINDIPPKTNIVQNSWSADWGAKGFFFLPFDFTNNPNRSDDFWTIRLVEAA
jgi:C1A family cysteine protease